MQNFFSKINKMRNPLHLTYSLPTSTEEKVPKLRRKFAIYALTLKKSFIF